MALQKFNRFLIVFLLIITGFRNFEWHYKYVDIGLSPYVQEYYNLLHDYCPNKSYNTTVMYNIKIVSDLDDEAIGVCYRFFSGYKILIKKPWWDMATDANKRQLIYHEMAHCLIYREHEMRDMSHYMYPEFNNILQEDLLIQTVQDIEDFCGK